MTGIVCFADGCPHHIDEPEDDCVRCAAAFWGRVFSHIGKSGEPAQPIVLHMPTRARTNR